MSVVPEGQAADAGAAASVSYPVWAA